MDRESRRRLDQYRKDSAGPVENALLDDLVSGELDRASFIRRATVVGLSTSVVAAALAAVGAPAPAFAARSRPKAGGRIRVGIIPAPAGALEPHTLVDVGG